MRENMVPEPHMLMKAASDSGRRTPASREAERTMTAMRGKRISQDLFLKVPILPRPNQDWLALIKAARVPEPRGIRIEHEACWCQKSSSGVFTCAEPQTTSKTPGAEQSAARIRHLA
ncbi:hypothetical protein MHYP_G00206470 [Metynnis hypsauchen]